MFAHCFAFAGELWFQSVAVAPCGFRDELGSWLPKHLPLCCNASAKELQGKMKPEARG